MNNTSTLCLTQERSTSLIEGIDSGDGYFQDDYFQDDYFQSQLLLYSANVAKSTKSINHERTTEFLNV